MQGSRRGFKQLRAAPGRQLLAPRGTQPIGERVVDMRGKHGRHGIDTFQRLVELLNREGLRLGRDAQTETHDADPGPGKLLIDRRHRQLTVAALSHVPHRHQRVRHRLQPQERMLTIQPPERHVQVAQVRQALDRRVGNGKVFAAEQDHGICHFREALSDEIGQ